MKELYTANYQKVKAYVLQNSGSSSQAKDIYQEAFITMWRNVRKERFTPQGDTALSGYLYRIAKNKWLDYLRSAHNKKIVPVSRLYAVQLPEDKEEEDAVLQEQENITEIMDAYGRLGNSCKKILEQFYFKRKSYRKISGELDMKEASVRNKKYRCMQKLREMVQNANN